AMSAGQEQVAALSSRVALLLDWATAQRSSWLATAEAREAFGRALGELDRFDDALAQYALALASGKADFPVSAIEQYANLMTRAALAEFRIAAKTLTNMDLGPQRNVARKKISRASKILGRLLEFAKTVERYSL